MVSDVEMQDVKIQDTSASKIAIPVLLHSPSPAPPQSVQPPTTTTKSTSKPASTTSQPIKPRSSKAAKARSPSPSPPPPPPVVPLRTIRLDIRLGGPSNYEVDIAKHAKETGQRPPTPPAPPKKVTDSSDEEEDDEEKKDKPKRKKRKNGTSEYYDTSDPFIDDSELAVDERQYFAQTKQQGFYVSSGEVALLKDKTPKKPKSKRPTLLSGLGITTTKKDATATVRKASTPLPDGSRDAPFPVEVDDVLPPSTTLNQTSNNSAARHSMGHLTATDHAVLQSGTATHKRKRPASVMVIGENGKKKKVVDETAFQPDLQKAITEMKGFIASESWEQKGKFPATLKPPLAKLALLAIRLDEYDDDFFSLMPQLFPYNKFTMTKLIKRTIFPDHIALLTERQEELLKQLRELAQAGFAKAEEEWEKSVLAWDKRQEKIRHEAAEASGATGTNSAGPTRHPTEEMDVDGEDMDKVKDKEDKDKDGQPTTALGPAKRYRLTDPMKSIIWELVVLSNECCRLENERNTLENSVVQVSDQGLRKVLYQKIVAAFPEGWVTSGQISRQVSVMNKKMEKEAMEQGDDD